MQDLVHQGVPIMTLYHVACKLALDAQGDQYWQAAFGSTFLVRGAAEGSECGVENPGEQLVCMSCLLTKYARVKVDGTALMQRFIQAMYVVPYLWAVPCGKCRCCLEYPGLLPWEGLVIIDAEEAYILYSLKLLVVSGLVQQGPCVIYKTIWTCWTLKKSMLVVKLVKA